MEVLEEDHEGVSALRFTFDEPLSKRGVHLFWGSRVRWALELEPDFAEAYNNMGAVLSFQGKYEEAIAYFSQALRVKPHYPEARTNLEFAQREVSRRVKKEGQGQTRPRDQD